MKVQCTMAIVSVAVAASTLCAVIDAGAQNTPTRKSFPEGSITLPEYVGLYAVDSKGQTTKLKRVDFAELEKLQHMTEAEGLAKLSKLNLEANVEFLVYGKEHEGAPMLLRLVSGQKESEPEKLTLFEKPVKGQPEMRRFIPETLLAPDMYMLAWAGFDAQGQPQSYMFVVGYEQLQKDAVAKSHQSTGAMPAKEKSSTQNKKGYVSGDTKGSWVERAGMQDIGEHSGTATQKTNEITVWGFQQETDSRIQYDFDDGFPTEGTIEVKICVDSGYSYSDSQPKADQPEALIFTTVGPDTWETGAAWLHVNKDGAVWFDQCTGPGGSSPNRTIKATNTPFRFKEWHVVSVSFGPQGRSLAVDGKEVARDDLNLALTGGSQRGGTKCRPTLGQMHSLCWRPRQHDSGFNGQVQALRASPKQCDWKL